MNGKAGYIPHGEIKIVSSLSEKYERINPDIKEIPFPQRVIHNISSGKNGE